MTALKTRASILVIASPRLSYSTKQWPTVYSPWFNSPFCGSYTPNLIPQTKWPLLYSYTKWIFLENSWLIAWEFGFKLYEGHGHSKVNSTTKPVIEARCDLQVIWVRSITSVLEHLCQDHPSNLQDSAGGYSNWTLCTGIAVDSELCNPIAFQKYVNK